MEIGGPFQNGTLELVLPSWRPGRYELGNFAKNIRFFKPYDDGGNLLEFKKISKDRWLIDGVVGPVVRVQYQYYANQPDAGACFVDDDQLYINPVHCCFFIPGREKEPCELVLDIPENWKTATGLQRQNNHTFVANDFDDLVDSPFISSPNLQYGSYTLDGVMFHIWFNGQCTPDWNRIIPDFEAFSQVQLNAMGDFPVRDFHFLIQVLPYRFYHGVEHLTSTVLALGPGHELMNDDLYKELLGVASHELFHCWNVKTIRPVEMMPYDYTKENYSNSGYVYEGITTYYGDLFLGRSRVFGLHEMLKEFSLRLQRHMDNPGRFNQSITESSYDTWLDGYVAGIPGKKVSIYDEGCLLAWLLDFMIRSATESSRSLDDVMRIMYKDFGRMGKGYNDTDFKKICESVSNRSLDVFFNEMVGRPSTLIIPLAEALSLAGLQIETVESKLPLERYWGIRTSGSKIKAVFPGSPGWISGLVADDEIVTVNGDATKGAPNHLIASASDITTLRLKIQSFGKIKEVELSSASEQFYLTYEIKPVAVVTKSQLFFREQWLDRH
jgi:predicted metalloprotease with PDZ domain